VIFLLIRITSVPVLVYVPEATLIVSPEAAFANAPAILAQAVVGLRQSLPSLPLVDTYNILAAETWISLVETMAISVTINNGVKNTFRNLFIRASMGDVMENCALVAETISQLTVACAAGRREP
jgi:hypothetical protein